MGERVKFIQRETNETKIELSLDIDGQGNSKLNTGIGFFSTIC